MDRSIVFLMQYFGEWPKWINFYIESCKYNRDIDWVVFTNCREPDNKARNVHYVHISLAEYSEMVSSRLGFSFRPREAYKLCDLKPALGHIHADLTSGYRFFGYGDIDVIYGNIRRFYDDETLSKYRVLSTHPERLAGHLALFMNDEQHRTAYKLIPNFQEMLQSDEFHSVAEWHFNSMFLGKPNALFTERYSTPGRRWIDGSLSHPRRWIWRKGKLVEDTIQRREYMYLHFMIWHSRRWHAHLSGQGAEESGAWLKLDTPINVNWKRAAKNGFCISPDGFTAAPQRPRQWRRLFGGRLFC